jgi:prolipoprotein diacylglyceryltransferase
VAALLIFLTPQLKSGQLFLLYIITYSLGRFFIEGIRIDQAHEIAGLRLNQWVSIAIISAGSVSFLRIGKNFR